jgi:hypothetical protein
VAGAGALADLADAADEPLRLGRAVGRVGARDLERVEGARRHAVTTSTPSTVQVSAWLVVVVGLLLVVLVFV